MALTSPPRQPPTRLALLAIALVSQAAQACTTCFGDPESAQTQAANNAILTLLGITCLVLTTAALFAAAVLRHHKTTATARQAPPTAPAEASQ